MRKRIVCVAVALVAAPVAAHDFWLQPRDFVLAASHPVALRIFVGHGPDKQRWGVGIDRVVRFVSIGPDGSVDRKGDLTLRGPAFDGVVRLSQPGTHLLALESSNAASDLPSVRYNSYAEAEGLTIPLAERARTGRKNDNGREVYSRRAKAIVQIGPVDPGQSALVTKPVGMALEIVPERNPLLLKPGEGLPVHVLFQGRPLAGALVKLTNLDADAKPVELHRSDAQGRAVFAVPRRGNWLVNTIWSVPVRNLAAADYQTIFSSLTFGFPDQPVSRPAR